ncbi:MAG: hypothetical protein HRU41_21250 [Saprospiraceae bacterium]|nr:hypothetical protein [Saprospiraceae bacterium]
MEPKERISQIEKIADIPGIDSIAQLPRGINWKFIFGAAVIDERERTGAKWKHSLPDFSIGIHTSEPIIQCLKLITDEEIIAHQDFFEQCAQDYGQLAGKLIRQLVRTFNIPFTPDFPLLSLNAYYGKKAYPTTGKMGAWEFYLHGFHCAFSHQTTDQYIEVPLTFGEEFGELDPYFFSKYILSSPEYITLPVPIFIPYEDGTRILEVMQQIGKFEEIPSNIPGRSGIIVSNRDKKKITVAVEGYKNSVQQAIPRKRGLGFWRKWLRFWKK